MAQIVTVQTTCLHASLVADEAPTGYARTWNGMPEWVNYDLHTTIISCLNTVSELGKEDEFEPDVRIMSLLHIVILTE